MLRRLRAVTKSKFAGVIIGALVVAFALWGVSDIFQGVIANVVAEVGNREISTVDFDRELRARMRAMSQQLGEEITLEQARAIGLDQTVLDDIISRAALDEKAAEFGLTASNETVSTVIQSTGGFNDGSGTFSYPLFLQTLQQNGLTEGLYVDLTRRDIARAQMLNSISAGLAPAPGLIRLYFDFVNETRVSSYIVLSPEDAGDIPEPSDEELAEYHMAHPELFSAPEYRAIEYVAITPGEVASQIEVSDADLEAAFADESAAFNTPERREIQQITFPDQATAEAAAASLADGANFAAIAEERGLSQDDIALGTIAANELAGTLGEAAFAVSEAGVTPPVQGPFGWAILNIVDIIPGETRSFEEVREPLRAQLLSERARGIMVDLANAFEDARAGGETLPEAATAVEIETHSIEALDNEGLTPDGIAAELPAEMSFLEQIFATPAGDESFLFQGLDENYYAIRVNGVTPSQLRPLDMVREDVRAGWLAEARAAALSERANMLAEEARSGTLETAAAGAGHAVRTTAPLERNSADEVFGANLLQQIFAVPPGAIIAGLAANGADYVVARVDEAGHPEPDTNSAEYAEFRNTMAQEMAGDVAQALAAGAREDAGVTTYPQVIQTFFGDPLL